MFRAEGLTQGCRTCDNRTMETKKAPTHMNNLIQHTTDLAMHIVQAYVHPGDTVVDATCGNGHDTLRLARMLGLDAVPEGSPADDTATWNVSPEQPPGSGHLFAFDIQPQAVEATRQRLQIEGFEDALVMDRITLACLGHEQMLTFLQERSVPEVSAIVFNLGYLPGGDKTLTTRTGTTLAAVTDALQLLRAGGLCCLTMYSGHPEGAAEKRALLAFAEGLDGKLWHVSYISMLNQKKDPPEILLISRKL